MMGKKRTDVEKKWMEEKVTTFFPKCEHVLHTDTEKLACELRNEVETANKYSLVYRGTSSPTQNWDLETYETALLAF